MEIMRMMKLKIEPGMPWRVPTAAALVAILAGACGSKEPQVYAIPKENESVSVAETAPPESSPAAGSPHTAGNPQFLPEQISWEVPDSWNELEESQQGEKNFTVPVEEGEPAQVSVLPFANMQGKEAVVVNIWREMMKLPAVNPDDVEVEGSAVEIGPSEGRMFDLVNPELGSDSAVPERTLVAMMHRPHATWFFKLVGDADSVEKARDSFSEFLKSVSFETLEHPPIQGSMSSSGMSAISSGGAANANLPEWKVPEGWSETAAGPMLTAAFNAADNAGGEAKVTVSSLGGDAGGTLANVNRWRGQLGLDPVESTQLDSVVQSLDVAAGPASLVDLTESADTTNDQGMLVVMVPHAGKTWFFKIIGNRQTVTQLKNEFLEFVQSVRYEGR